MKMPTVRQDASQMLLWGTVRSAFLYREMGRIRKVIALRRKNVPGTDHAASN